MSAATIPAKVLDNGRKMPDHPAYFVKRGGAWHPTTWRQYAAEVQATGKALMALGVNPADRVTILGFNRPEWVLMDVGAMSIGAVPAGIYTTNSPAECEYIINHSESPVILLEDHGQWEKINEVRQQLSSLRHVVMMKDADPIDDELVMSWDEFIAKGEAVSDDDFQARVDGIELDDMATLIYTSGTTGPPKAVMLSHDNLAWTASTGVPAFGLNASDRGLSYLPLSHIAEQMFTIHIPATIGGSVYYAESIDALADNIKEVRPTYFAGVPRVWERFYAGVTEQLGHATGVKAKIADWAMGVGRKANALRMRGEAPAGMLAAQEKVADTLVLSKVREALGLNECRTYITAAAPISQEIQEFFSAFFVLNEIYGQSEDCGPTAMTQPGKTKFGTVGPAFPEVDVRIADDGEILVKGRNVFMGYFKDEAATKETLADGWLYSGDLGEFDDDGYLTITGRKKDIIITAGGKNVAPKNLEGGLKNHPLISEAVVIGDRRKYLTCVVTLDEDAAAAYLEKHGLEGPAHESSHVQAEVQAAVDLLNAEYARVEQLKKFAILPRQLSIEGGELTPTLKVKRNKVAEHFSSEIEAMYAD
ncbi:MAG: long-chain fatty acid--CoA ligase [Acidimicrobiia bacterium]|nr:long-chain fatty acid--CoA ligase [Acidimicrobiia bacterium]